MNSETHLIIVTHSNYRHWIYLLDEALCKSEAGLNVTVLDCRGIAKNDTNSYIIQSIERMYKGNIINRTLKELRDRDIDYIRVHKSLLKIMNLQFITYLKSLMHLNGKSKKGKFEAVMSHLKAESGSLDFQITKGSKKAYLEALCDYDRGYSLYKKYISENGYSSASLSHGRLPIQLGIIHGLKEDGINIFGIQQGGNENKIFKVPGGVHNQNYWRKSLKDFIDKKKLNSDKSIPEKEYSNNPFSYHESYENKLKMKKSDIRKYLNLNPYIVFYTGYDGEDSFVISFEKSGNIFSSEMSALQSFYETALELNIHPVIRIHPRNEKRVTNLKSIQNEIRENEIKLSFPKATIINSLENDDSYELGRRALCSFSFHSTLGLELGYEGFSTIFTGPTYFSSIFPDNHVFTKEQMKVAVEKKPIMNKNTLKLLIKWDQSKGEDLKFFHYVDGQSNFLGKKVVGDSAVLLKIRKLKNLLA